MCAASAYVGPAHASDAWTFVSNTSPFGGVAPFTAPKDGVIPETVSSGTVPVPNTAFRPFRFGRGVLRVLRALAFRRARETANVGVDTPREAPRGPSPREVPPARRWTRGTTRPPPASPSTRCRLASRSSRNDSTRRRGTRRRHLRVDATRLAPRSGSLHTHSFSSCAAAADARIVAMLLRAVVWFKSRAIPAPTRSAASHKPPQYAVFAPGAAGHRSNP